MRPSQFREFNRRGFWPATAVASREQGTSDMFDLTFLSSRVDGHRVSCWKEDTGCRIS